MLLVLLAGAAIGFVTWLVGALSRSAELPAARPDTVDQRQQLRDVVAVAARQGDRQRDPARVGQQMMLGAGPGTVNRRRPGQGPLKSTDVAAIDHRRRPVDRTGGVQAPQQFPVQRSEHPGRLPLLQPAMRHRRREPSSRGRCRHTIPVNSTNTIAPKHTRSSTRGRPPRGSGSCTGTSGCTTSHSSSRSCHIDAANATSSPDYVSLRRFAAGPSSPLRAGIETASKGGSTDAVVLLSARTGAPATKITRMGSREVRGLVLWLVP